MLEARDLETAMRYAEITLENLYAGTVTVEKTRDGEYKISWKEYTRPRT